MMARRMRSERRGRGITLLELVMAVAILGLLLSLAWPLLLSAREVARRHQCQQRIRTLGAALHSYHDQHAVLPPAAVWNTSALQGLSLHTSRRVDLYTHENWLQLLLPAIDEQQLAGQFRPGLPIGAPEHMRARTTHLPGVVCPSDPFSRPGHQHDFDATPDMSISFARGNYAINGGSHCFKDGPGSTAFLTGDAAHLEVDVDARTFRMWGNGIAGFNAAFPLDAVENGSSTLIAVEEIRAGVHPLDPRGVWSLGQIGGSVTWAHGVNGDAFGPNNPHPRSDDILNCPRLHEVLGPDRLAQTGMPCVSYVDQNFQATSRSSHPGGVNVCFLDGSVRFIGNSVDPGLWHVLHSRETPPDVASAGLSAIEQEALPEAPTPTAADHRTAPQELVNSLGMEFRLIPAGEFVMGIPDAGNDDDVPQASPAHRVRLTRAFLLGRHEVTAHQFAVVMSTPDSGSGQLPARDVTWNEAAEFCSKLSARPEEVAAGRRYRLPTEAEWEYAAREGRSVPFQFSFQRAPDDVSGAAGGILPPLDLRPVGSYPENAFGLHDMRGNVWEWCRDWFAHDYYSRSPNVDPQGPARGYIKVVRGGDWTFVGEGCKISYPMLPPWKSSPFVGFRVVCELVPASPDRVHVSNS